ncbi:hypothetical protein XarbCFBP8152_08915 [Xanthomonas arboricola]|nr:hypothetical protein XarbCFBP8152_08915 [Xanthomonas arboricola]
METVKSLVRRARGALTTCGTRRKDVRVGSVAASMPPHGPATGEGTAPENWLVAFSRDCCSALGGRRDVCGLRAESPSTARLAMGW